MLLLEGHTGPVTSVCYTPQGDRLASTSADGTTRIWDFVSGEASAVLRDSDGPLQSAAYSPDGRRLAVAGDDAVVLIYDARTLRLLATCSGSYWPISSIAWSPEADRIAAASSDRVHGSTVVVWQIRGVQKVGAFQIGHHQIHDLSFTPNGRHVAVASGMPALLLWSPVDAPFSDVAELTPGLHAMGESAPHLLRIAQRFAVNSVSFLSNRRWLATADGDDVALWEMRTGRLIAYLSYHREGVAAIDSAVNGGLLASAGGDGIVCIWDTFARRPRAQFDWQLGPLTDVVFSPDGQTAAASGGSTIVVWDVE